MNLRLLLISRTISILPALSAGIIWFIAPVAHGQTTPVITLQPQSVTVVYGDQATFTAAATGSPDPGARWEILVNGTWQPLTDTYPYSGANTATLTIRFASNNLNGATYHAVFQNGFNSLATSNPAVLTVSSAPIIVSSPNSVSCHVGDDASFGVGATGSAPLNIQWQRNNVDIEGATSPTYVLTNVHVSDSGSTFRAVVTNSVGTATSFPATLTVNAVGTPELGDFNGDGKADIVWTDTTTGERAMWLMNGGALAGGASLGTVPSAWKISGTGDFDGDGKADVVLSNTATGDRAMWLMNGTTVVSNLYLGNVSTDWTISAVGDFDGDGKADIFWTNTVTGDRSLWFMNGGTLTGGAYLGSVPVEWKVSGTGDFNGDGKSDIVWTNTATGERAMWLMNGGTLLGGASLGVVPTAWTISGVGDFDGDGKADLVFSNTSTGDRAMWLMNGTILSSNLYLGNAAVEWTIGAVGDYNGDGKADLFWGNTVTGDRTMWLMNGGILTEGDYLGSVPVEWVNPP